MKIININDPPNPAGHYARWGRHRETGQLALLIDDKIILPWDFMTYHDSPKVARAIHFLPIIIREMGITEPSFLKNAEDFIEQGKDSLGTS